MTIRRFVYLATVAISCACHWRAVAPDAVAIVNGEAITRQAFDETVARNVKRYSAQARELPPTIMVRIQESVLRRMVDDIAIEQRARREGIDMTADELSAKFTEHKGRFTSEQAFNDYLARANITADVLQEDLRKSLLKERLIAKLSPSQEVGEAAVRAYYEENQDHFSEPEQMKVRRLLLAVPADASAVQRRAVVKRAQALLQKARAHPEHFAALCRDNSQGPEASRGGDMGVVAIGRIPELGRFIAQGLQQGAISGVADSKVALTLFKIDEHKAKHTRPLSEVESSIRTTLSMRQHNQRRLEVMRDLEANSDVKWLINFANQPTGTAPQVPSLHGSAAALDSAQGLPAARPLTPPGATPTSEPSAVPGGDEGETDSH